MITLKRKFVISCVILTAFTAICSSVFAENDRGRTAMKPRAKSAEMHRHVEMLLDQIEQESPEEAKALLFSEFPHGSQLQGEGVKVLSGNGGMKNKKMDTKVNFITGDEKEIGNELTKEFGEILVR